MNSHRPILAATALSFLVISTALQAQDNVAPLVIDHISVQLFYEHSGALSADISPPNDFVGWNTIIGEGSAREPANDMLVTVRLKTDGHQFIDERPLLVEARAQNQHIAYTHATAFLTSDDGFVHVPLWLHDIGCVGELTILARLGDQQRSATVNLGCGE